jgi:hypothetical protein
VLSLHFEAFLARHASDLSRIARHAHPLTLLEDAEAATPEPDDPDPCHSAAAAWIWLLQRFDQRMDRIAAFLLISGSWCYACRRKAWHQACTQWPLPHGLSVETGEGTPWPWRQFKLPRVQGVEATQQLGFDYWSRPAQPSLGQMWLLYQCWLLRNVGATPVAAR